MGLTTKQIAAAETNEALFRLLLEELARLFPPSFSENTAAFLAALRTAPQGMRAMSAIYELDVSMALDDLAWHFVNHHDARLYEETRLGLHELEAHEAAVLFEKAYAITAPRWDELGTVLQKLQGGEIHGWLDSTGIQQQIDPLNREMWRLKNQNREYGLIGYWLSYARSHPERCVGGESPTKGGNRPLPDEAK
jgi:hypothetical protein